MNRVAVVGCSGSGKTTLARALARSLDCPYVELDAIFHLPNWQELPEEEFKTAVREAAGGARWVIDGNYSVVRDIVWERADTIIWFDLSFVTVMSRVIRRTMKRAVLRTELWNGNREPLSNLTSFDPQKSIIAWTASRHGLSRQRYTAAEDDPRWSELRFIRIDTRASARRLLTGISTGRTKE